MTKKGIIFDLDGTLWDSSDSVTKSWNDVISTCENINYRMTVESMKGFMGKTIDEIADLFFAGLPKHVRKDITDKCIRYEQEYIERHGGILFPNVLETLESLSKEYKLYIVSNCQEGYIESFMKYHKLDKYFDDFENAGRTGKTKGENIRLVMERNNLGNSVYIGDTQGDFNAAKFAEIPFIHARYGFGEISEPVVFVESVCEIPIKVRDMIQ